MAVSKQRFHGAAFARTAGAAPVAAVPHPRLGEAASHGADLHRTTLSWTRTALDLALVSLVMLRIAAWNTNFFVVLCSLSLIALALGLAWVSKVRTHRCQAYGQAGDGRLPAAIVGLSLGVCVVGAFLVVSI